MDCKYNISKTLITFGWLHVSYNEKQRSLVTLQRAHICDIMCKNVPYGWMNIVGPDQTPRIILTFAIYSGNVVHCSLKSTLTA